MLLMPRLLRQLQAVFLCLCRTWTPRRKRGVHRDLPGLTSVYITTNKLQLDVLLQGTNGISSPYVALLRTLTS